MKARVSRFLRAAAQVLSNCGYACNLALLIAFIFLFATAPSCVEKQQKAAEVVPAVDEASLIPPVDTAKLQQAAADIRFTFGVTDAGRKSGWSGEPDEVCYSLAGPALYDKTNVILIAYPPKPAEHLSLLKEASNVNATMASTALQDTLGMRYIVSHGQNLFVFYINSSLMSLLEPGRTIRESDANDYSESEFRKKFPQGMEAAFALERKPDGRFVIEIGSKAKKKKLVSCAETVEYVRQHGNPWTCWRNVVGDSKKEEVRVTYFVIQYNVNFKAAEFPMASLILENIKDVVAVSRISPDGKAELIDSDGNIADLAKSLLGGESKYEIDF